MAIPAALYIIHEDSPLTAAEAAGVVVAALALGATLAFTSLGSSSTGGAVAADPALLLSAGAGDFDWRLVFCCGLPTATAGEPAGVEDLAGVDDDDLLADGAGDAALRGGMFCQWVGGGSRMLWMLRRE